MVTRCAKFRFYNLFNIADFYQVSFACRDRDQLVIQAYKDDQTFELVPHSQLSKDFPEFLSTDYHHWANLENKTVEFRLLVNPWCPSSRQWDLRFAKKKITLQNVGGASKLGLLIDMHSELFHALSHRLNPLESSHYLHVTQTTPPGPQIHIELPRMNLSFFINQKKELESSNFCDQVVDTNQSIGTMYGLKNRLVLCPKDLVARSLPRSRSVLIPHGDVQFAKVGHHVLVTVKSGSARNVPFYRYLVDSDLGYLMSDAGLTSRLFKVYLHALTSHCLPDPLTGRTGTEEAICQVSEPASSSFETLDKSQAKLLWLIGQLTPKREYYPAHLRCMQTTNWGNLPSLSQHFAFSTASVNILRRAITLQQYHSLKLNLQDYIVTPQGDLLKRATRRTSVYYPSDETDFVTQILDSVALKDNVYTGRGGTAETWEEAGQAAGWASRLTFCNWGRAVYKPYGLVALAEDWKTIEGVDESLELTYSSAWLDLKPSAAWFAIYDLCRLATISGNKYALSTCLASAAFSRKLPMDLIATLAAIASNPAFQHMHPPLPAVFELGNGYQPTVIRVEELVASTAREIDETPTITMTRRNDESEIKFEQRRRLFYSQEIKRCKAGLVWTLMSQWPSTHPRVISPEYSKWFKAEKCVQEVENYFTSCDHNIKLRNHLRKIERELSSQPVSNDTTFQATAADPLEPQSPVSVATDIWHMLRLESLMRARDCPHPENRLQLKNLTHSRPANGSVVNTSRLSGLFNEFKRNDQPLNRRYGSELDESRTELATKSPMALLTSLPPVELLTKNGQEHRLHLETTFQRLQSSMAPSNALERVIFASGIWPRLTPRAILHQLSFKARLRFGAPCQWHDTLISYARSFTEYQQSQRLVSLATSGRNEEFHKEIDCMVNSSAETRDPDWLLVQVSY